LDFPVSPSPSSRTMGLGSTQPLIEMSTRNLPGGIGRPARVADGYLENVRISTSHNPVALHGLLRDSFTIDRYLMSLAKSSPLLTEPSSL
jgi:hypothetical protein